MLIKKNFRAIGEVTADCIQLANNSKPKRGIKTGFDVIDRLAQGLQPGAISLVAARPSLGKTIFALNMAENIAINQQMPVAYFSLDMKDTGCMQHILSSLTGIERHKMMHGKCTKDEVCSIQEIALNISEAPLFFSSSCQMSVTEICNHIESLHDELDVKVVMIDYLQLFRTSFLTESGELVNDVNAIQKLKKLAARLDVAIVVLSQLDRGVEIRANKRPVLSDLWEPVGGAEQIEDFENYSSLVLFIYRDDVYNENSKDKNLAEITVAKNDFGAVGTTYLTFNGKHSKFK